LVALHIQNHGPENFALLQYLPNVGLIVAGASDCSGFMRSTTLLSNHTGKVIQVGWQVRGCITHE
jgi:hypothetical protein